MRTCRSYTIPANGLPTDRIRRCSAESSRRSRVSLLTSSCGRRSSTHSACTTRSTWCHPSVARPFPIGAGKDRFGFGFQIEAAPPVAGLRGIGSLSWGGIDNTHFWIDPHAGIAAAVLMQVLPYYDERALNVLRGFERLVYEWTPS